MKRADLIRHVIFVNRKVEIGSTLKLERAMNEYIEQRNGDYYVTGTRISLASIVHLYWDGRSPASILHNLPLLGDADTVHAAIAFYLSNRAMVDSYLEDKERRYDVMRSNQPPLPASLAAKLERAKEELAGKKVEVSFQADADLSKYIVSEVRQRIPAQPQRLQTEPRPLGSG